MVNFSYAPKAGLEPIQIYQVEMRTGRSLIINVHTDDPAGLVEQFNRAEDKTYACRLMESCGKCGKMDSEVIDGLCSCCYYESLEV